MRMLWPRTLLWRTFGLIVLLLALSMVAWFQIYDHYGLRPRARQAAQLVISIVNITRSALLASDATQRFALLRDLTSQEGIRIYPAEADDPITPLQDSPFTRSMIAELRQKLGNYTRISSEYRGQQGFFVSFRLDPDVSDDEYWVMLPPGRVFRSEAASWIGWGTAAILLSLVGAYFIVFGVTRPLKSLEQAARAVGQGEPPPMLPEQGARELAAVAQAFNQMSRDLSQLESDRALILAGISHDLKTPLARLRLGIEMSGAVQEDIDAMSTDIEEMDRIINQFLDFARDAHAEAPAQVAPGELLGSIAQNYIRRGNLVTVNLSDTSEIVVRPLALRRAVTNLVDNALRYAGPEHPIELHASRLPREIWIEVMDRGPGIPEHEIARLMRPFTRLENARTDVKGSGLGLAIVDRIARMHGGNLELRAREGGGLCARLRLPA